MYYDRAVGHKPATIWMEPNKASGLPMGVQPAQEGATIVVVGEMNPAIFTPDWLLRENLIGEEDYNGSELEVVHREISILKFDALTLTVRLDRLQLEARLDALPIARDLVLSVFTQLSHTPAREMGINRHMHFSVSADLLERAGDVFVHREWWNPLIDEPKVLSLVMRGTRPGGSSTSLQTTIEPSTKTVPGVYVGTNEHFHADGSQTLKQLMIWLESEWEPALDHAKRIGETVLQRITEDDNA